MVFLAKGEFKRTPFLPIKFQNLYDLLREILEKKLVSKKVIISKKKKILFYILLNLIIIYFQFKNYLISLFLIKWNF